MRTLRRRLLALTAIRDGANRTDAARVGGMDRQTLRDWVHRFNAEGPDGLRDHRHTGPACRLNAAQQAECLVPGFDGALFSREWKEALWARFTTGAPRRQRQSVERYSIVKRA